VASGCPAPTSTRKPYCEEHLDESSHIREVKDRITAYEAAIERAKKHGVFDEMIVKDLLVPIWVHGGRTAREIAAESGIDFDVAGRCLDTLEAEGFVEGLLIQPRRRSRRPRRPKRILVLTEHGGMVIEKHLGHAAPPVGEANAGRVITAGSCSKCFMTCLPTEAGLCRACRDLPPLRADEPLEPVPVSFEMFIGAPVQAKPHEKNVAPEIPCLRCASTSDPESVDVATDRAANRELAEHMLRGREAGARIGRHQGGPAPYGYRRDETSSAGVLLRIDEAEAKIVRFIFGEYLRVRSMLRLVELLDSKRFRTRRGGQWSRAGLAWILKNDTYIGRVHFGSIRSRGLHESIVSRDVYDKVQRLIRQNDKRTRPAEAPALVLTPSDAPVATPGPMKVDTKPCHVTCTSQTSEPSGMISGDSEGGRDMTTAIEKKRPRHEKTFSVAANLASAHRALEKAVVALSSASDDQLANRLLEFVEADVRVSKVRSQITEVICAPIDMRKIQKKAKAASKKAPAKPKKEPPVVKPGGAFSAWLRKVRAASALTQPQFGDKIGASRTQMWHWEKGTTAPGEAMLRRIEVFARESCPA